MFGSPVPRINAQQAQTLEWDLQPAPGSPASGWVRVTEQAGGSLIESDLHAPAALLGPSGETTSLVWTLVGRWHLSLFCQDLFEGFGGPGIDGRFSVATTEPGYQHFSQRFDHLVVGSVEIPAPQGDDPVLLGDRLTVATESLPGSTKAVRLLACATLTRQSARPIVLPSTGDVPDPSGALVMLGAGLLLFGLALRTVGRAARHFF